MKILEANPGKTKDKDETKSYTTDGKVKHFTQSKTINEILADELGETFLRYRKDWDAANRFELVTEFPLFIHLDMNQRCNYRCPQCIIGVKDAVDNFYEKGETNWSDFVNIIDEGSEYKCPSLSVQGNNEPLLIRNLEDYIIYARKKGFIDIMFNTNASLLTEERAKSILDSGVTRIRFSLDAINKKTYEKIRLGGDFDKVYRNIEKFLDIKRKGGYKLPVTGVSFVVQSENYAEVDDFKNYWKERVDMVTLQNFLPPIPTGDFTNFYPPSQFYSPSDVSSFKCVQPYQRIVIRNKVLTPCCAMYSSILSLGNIPETTVYEAWNSDKMNELRRIHKAGNWQANSICKTCVKNTFPPDLRSKL